MATGPSLDSATIEKIYAQDGWRYIGISDTYRSVPFLDFFYACDQRWWLHHYEKVMDWGRCGNGYWCTENVTKKKYPNLNWIKGSGGNGWSTDPSIINYGGNSGFQIMNIAYLLGIKYMVLVGFNMMVVGDQRHFFGDHPKGMSINNNYQSFASQFKSIDPIKHGVTVVNTASPTALKHFPEMSLDDAIAQYK